MYAYERVVLAIQSRAAITRRFFSQNKKVSELNRRGDLLMTYGHAWKYGQTHVECEDFDTGEPVSVEVPRGTEAGSVRSRCR